MNRIDRRFADLARTRRTALIPYVTAGYPHPDCTVDVLHALVAGGADLLELGLPFSDPMADGPVIQAACERALAAGVRVGDVLEMVRQFRETDQETPLVLMGYLNPLVRFGMERFAQTAAAAGVDGVLMVDAPPEEAAILAPLKAAGIHPIYLLAPTSDDARIERVVAAAGGFVYYVALTGVTGASHLSAAQVAEPVARIRRHTGLPVGVGFGIKAPADAVAVAAAADAVVIGSALVAALAEAESAPAAARLAREFLAPFRGALDHETARRAG